MDPERAERVAELFEQALPMTPQERRGFSEMLRDEDADLARELESLLAAYEESPDSLDVLAAQVLPPALSRLSRALETGPPLREETIGRYRVLERLGSGGMGEVYQAHDPELGRLVALKLLPTHLTADPGARDRLKTEARAASALDHPNVAVVHEIGATHPEPGSSGPERLFIVMAYYTGETIKEKISRGPLPLADALDYAVQMAEGLDAAHEAGIVHRDIKPANLIVTERGQVKIVDFGLAKVAGAEGTREGTTRGTVAYMSPEQTRGGPLDHRTDLWSFGAMLYEMLTARRPFRGGDDAVLIHAIRHDEPEPLASFLPEAPPELAALVHRCLAKDPGARYPATALLLAELRAVYGAVGLTPDGVPAPAPPVRRSTRSGQRAPGEATMPQRRFRRALATNKLRVALGAALIGALVVTLAIVGARSPPDGSPTATADRDLLRIAVLPLSLVAADPDLESLGRDLVVRLTAGLDGMGDLRAVDAPTTLALAPRGEALSLAEADALARRLSAGRHVHGALTRAGPGLRLDVSIYDTGITEPIARASVTADDPATLGDAAAVALLDQLWQSEPPPVPSLAALTGSSVPAARRAYIEGELAMARTDAPTALEAFERAFAADTTFWWAYWRSRFPRAYRDGMAFADPALERKVIEHRWELWEPDRLLVEASWMMTRSRNERLARLARLTDRFPSYELAWWDYANLLVHEGGYLGYTPEDARQVLERFLTLNPHFAPAWDHLLWVALVQGDSATAARAAREADRLSGDTPTRRHMIAIWHLRAGVSRSGSIHPDSLDGVVDFILTQPPGLVEAISSGLVADGHPAAQIQLNRAVRERLLSPALAASFWRGEALAWTARGAWDSTLVAADRSTVTSPDGHGPLAAYQLAVAGVMLGAVPAAEATRRRPPSPSGTSRAATYQRSELAWLDGVLAYLEGQAHGIESARRALTRDAIVSPWDSVSRGVLDRSLAALALDAAGDREGAAREMVALEAEIADRLSLRQVGEFHPALTSVNRLLAARWLRALGDHAGAARLLTWHEAIPGPSLLQAWNRSVGGTSLVDRAEIAETAGDTNRALRDYTRFLEQFDLADPALRPLVERAAAGVERVADERRRATRP
jgi:tetratricopeptide (TPR) repeat protein